MGADLITNGTPAAKQPGTEGIILDRANNALYTFGKTGVPALVGTSGSAPAAGPVPAAYAPSASPTFTGVVTIPAGASIVGFAPLASPTFTGAVTQPAPPVLTAATTQTTVGAAGGASALPATPTGYLQISINGTVFKIPYYAAA